MKKMIISIVISSICLSVTAQQTEFPFLQNKYKKKSPFVENIPNKFLIAEEKINKALTIPIIKTDNFRDKKTIQLLNGNKIYIVPMENTTESNAITSEYENPYGEDGLYKYDKRIHLVLPKKAGYDSPYGDDGQYKYDKGIHAVPPRKQAAILGR